MLCTVTLSRMSFRLRGNVKKSVGTSHATDDNIIRRMRGVCWITGYRQSAYEIRNVVSRQKQLHEPTLVLLCMNISYLVYLNMSNLTL
jgi:hypothetical protein